MYKLTITTTRGDIIVSSIRSWRSAKRSFDSLSPNRDAGVLSIQLTGTQCAINLKCSL